ncbi:MAG TPA: GGDEF domain-containing protein [Gemmatimonadales bacterium]|jgi:diguanylate cyclase (GGDEF)-like protein|nr:GGDEF domain-containing protein [Gemmatimonadales bacterium]
MLRECLPIIVLGLAAIGALTWAIMALRRSLAREQRLARVDDLTGVRNARAFHEAAGAEIERARRYQHPFSVAAVDLGTRVGDELVRSAAATLRGALRATDVVARLGRDEFIALLPETTAASARIVLEKLRAGLAELRTTDGKLAVPSIGGVTFLNPPRAVEEIVRATDERIAEAKSTGTPSHVTWNAAPAPGLEGR